MIESGEIQKSRTEALDPDKWIDVDGKELTGVGGGENYTVEAADDKKRMGYDTNNGVLAYVDRDGRMRVAPGTQDRLDALARSGYKHKGFGVPLSNQERFTDPQLQERWEQMRTAADDQDTKERAERSLEAYRRVAEEKGIKPLEGDLEWLDLDGKELTGVGGGENYTVEPNTDRGRTPDGRLKSVGTFDSNNNTLAYVDGEGHMHAGPSSSDRYNALLAAGYEHGSFGVPLSNGEHPTDPQLRERWEQMRDGAGQ